MDGYLDDVQIYNQRLTGGESAEAMTLPPAPPPLTFKVSAGQLTLSWSAPGAVLQENSDVTNAAGRKDVIGGESSPAIVTLPRTGNNFSRVRKP